MAPLEVGGPIARQGFHYQDHIAANKCLAMLLPGGPIEVWCEAEDDIVLVWATGDEETFEFIQVKGSDIGQAWTVARLCQTENDEDGNRKPSLVEKSLAHDRGAEQTIFRLVTRWKPHADLNVLLTPRTDRTHPSSVARLAFVRVELAKKLHKATSPNKHGLDYWVNQTEWECVASEADAMNAGFVMLTQIVDSLGEYLAPGFHEEVYARLNRKVQEASCSTNPNEKMLRKDDLLGWVRHQIAHVQGRATPGSGRLEEKLNTASIASDQIASAKELRRQYLHERRRSKYLCADEL